MTNEQWNDVEAFLTALSELPAAERPAGLAAIADADVRREVAVLLEQTLGVDPFLEAIAGAAAGMHSIEPGGELQGKRLGPYRLVRRLGHGGQGTVFEAARDDGAFSQRVAIKVVKWEMDSPAARNQFRHERQILAGLEHPFIARLLDGGESEDATPYLVMEYVDGQRLTDGTRDWTLKQKLELFLHVAAAVAFAHRNLIVHRDLKPANILVTKDGTPKLLDFGIAKLLDTSGDSTITSSQALTPDYASPEQVRGEVITTASDVYSLGVVLYELLTSKRPYEVRTTAPGDIVKAVCLTPMTPPNLSGDLDNILAMAMHKEVARRYTSVEQFAEDIERSMTNRPVLARKDGTLYHLGKYARRNWIGLLAASLTLTAILGGAAVALYQARIAQQRFNEVRQLSNAFLFDFDKEIASLPGAVKARQMLVDTALKYLNNLSRDARGDTVLQRELAQAFKKVGDVQGQPGGASLGKLDEALVSYRKSFAMYEELARREPQYRWEFANSHRDLGWALQFAWDLPAALGHYRAAIEILNRLHDEKPADAEIVRTLARAYGELAQGYLLDLKDSEALAAIQKSIGLNEASIADLDEGKKARIRVSGRTRLLTVYAGMGDASRGLAVASELTPLLATWIAATPNDVVTARFEMAREEQISQMYDSDYVPSLGDTRQALVHIGLADALAQTLMKDKNDADALEIRAFHLRRFSYLHGKTAAETGVREAREAIAILENFQRSGRGNEANLEVLASTRMLLAEHLSKLGKKTEATALIDQSLAAYRAMLAKANRSAFTRRALLRGMASAARCWRNLNDREAALRVTQEAAEDALQWQSEGSREISLLYVLGDVYVERGRALGPPEGRDWLERDAAIWREFPKEVQYAELRLRRAEANLLER